MDQVVDRRSANQPDEPEGPPPATHARFECPGCKKVEVYALTQEAAREVVKRHVGCKHGKRRKVKKNMFAGLNLFPKR